MRVTVGEVLRPGLLSLSTYRLIRVITLTFKELSPFHLIFFLSFFICPFTNRDPMSRVIRKLAAVLH
jgi:hypothetical protein